MRKLSRHQASINITPYIDILPVLLIIFMVLQPTRDTCSTLERREAEPC